METESKTFVTSDIHGCFTEFSKLLDLMNIDFRNDRLIILGDYIDRGSQSFAVVTKVMDLQKEFGADHVILLRGNHEQMAVNYYTTGDDLWDFNENRATIDSFSSNYDDVRHYLDFFRGLPLLYQDEYAIYVHAGIDPSKGLAEQDEEDLLWIRDRFFKSKKTFPKTVIFGHTPTLFLTGHDDPVILADRIGIDTGCVYGGSLSGVQIQRGQAKAVFQVKRQKQRPPDHFHAEGL